MYFTAIKKNTRENEVLLYTTTQMDVTLPEGSQNQRPTLSTSDTQDERPTGQAAGDVRSTARAVTARADRVSFQGNENTLN